MLDALEQRVIKRIESIPKQVIVEKEPIYMAAEPK